jgi:serine/threonine-protein kinase
MAQVFGKYEIKTRLAVGGMGEVFLAAQSGVPGFERPAILKTLLPELAQDPAFIQQFLDEARVAATLNHPNIVSIYEVGEWQGVWFIAMELIEGRDVSKLARRAAAIGTRVPPEVAARIVRDAALGLAHAHAALDAAGRPLGIVHRDISPNNLMVRNDGLTKVVDFGIALAANRAARTATGMVKGKLAYMAPEQITGRATPLSDQYSLGLVLWELLAGRRLFQAENDFQLVRLVTETKAVPPPSSVREVPEDIEAIAMRMLARDPRAPRSQGYSSRSRTAGRARHGCSTRSGPSRRQRRARWRHPCPSLRRTRPKRRWPRRPSRSSRASGRRGASGDAGPCPFSACSRFSRWAA